MNDQDYLDFLTIWGGQFCVSMRAIGVTAVAPHDAYEAFLEAFLKEPTPELLASISETELEAFRIQCEKVLDHAPIPSAGVREAISLTLWRWGVEGEA